MDRSGCLALPDKPYFPQPGPLGGNIPPVSPQALLGIIRGHVLEYLMGLIPGEIVENLKVEHLFPPYPCVNTSGTQDYLTVRGSFTRHEALDRLCILADALLTLYF